MTSTETSYDFDAVGRLVKHQQKIGDQSYQLEYGYNLAGQLTSERYPSGRIVTNGFDAKGRMTSVADADRTYLGGVTFGAKTLPTQIALGNGTVQNFDFNERLQMKSQDLKRGTEVLQKYEYGFGELNPQSQLKNNGKLESVVSYIGSQKQWTQKFSYDSVGRLKEARETRGDNEALSYKQVFEFDRFGNLFRKATSNPTTGQDTPIVFTPIETGDIDPATNRFTTASGTTYNDAGQVVTDGKFRNLGYGYDANGRMVRVSQTNVPDAVSVYDALGNRVAEKVNDVWQFVIYDAFGKLVAEYGGTVPQDEGGVKYYLQDWQGSVRAGLNAAGFVKSRTDHQAFGEDITSGVGLRTTAQGFGAPQANRQGYGLTEKDSTGLNHTWFRKNENRAGRWTSPDPYNGSASVGNPQSWNRYSYVENQPTNYVDPSGLLTVIYRCEPDTYKIINGELWIFAGQCSFWVIYDPPVGGGGLLLGDGPDIVALAVDRAVDILQNGCWNAQLGNGVSARNESFANLDKAATEGWSGSVSTHNRKSVESPVVASKTVISVVPSQQTSDPAMLAKIGNTTTEVTLNYVVKYYEGEGAAVTYRTSDPAHFDAAIQFGLGKPVNVSIGNAFLELIADKECKRG